MFAEPFQQVRQQIDYARDVNSVAHALLDVATSTAEKHAHPLVQMTATIALAVSDETMLAHEWWTIEEPDLPRRKGIINCAVVTPTRLIDGQFKGGDSHGYVAVREHSTITCYEVWLPDAMRTHDADTGALREPLALGLLLHYVDGKAIELGSREPRSRPNSPAPGFACAKALFGVLSSRD